MRTVLLTLCLLSLYRLQAQSPNADSLYSPKHLREDLAYLQQQLRNVHANPYTELNAAQYDELFNTISRQLNKSKSAIDFLQLVKPLIAQLSDEHAHVGLAPERLPRPFTSGKIYLPFTLEKRAGQYLIDQVFPGCLLKKGEVVRSIDNVSIGAWIAKASNQVSGTPEQRRAIAARRFGYLFGWVNEWPSPALTIATDKNVTRISSISLNDWNNFTANPSASTGCNDRISYRQVGQTAVIDACSFDVKPSGNFTLARIQQKIDSIFLVIQEAGLKSLLIDVSHNAGGNSAVGDYLIACISSKPYQGYQNTWKRSLEYQQLYESWGIKNDAYANTVVGKVIVSAPRQITPQQVPYPFTGKVAVAIGQQTFSSAILFATIIKDNKIVPLVGEVPLEGHPNHFGEMYNTKLPHTKLELRFGVKEWIRPAGRQSENDNVLVPDIILSATDMQDVQEIIYRARLNEP